MVKHTELEKIYSALIVPMNDDQSINYENLSRIVKLEMQDGVEGFYVCGSSGEALLLTTEERKKVLETVLAAAEGKVPVIAHVGTIRTADAIELAQHARDCGANAISMIPPYYYNFSMDEILSYYEDILHAVPGIPGIIYNIPQFTGVEFTKENAGRLLENPNIIGVKHTSKNLYGMERIHHAYEDKVIFNGFDEQFLGALGMGASSMISTTVNLFMPLFYKVRENFLKGDMKAALEAQKAINHRIEVTCSIGIFNAVKYGWTLRGVDCGSCRSPFKPLTPAQKEIMKNLMSEELPV